MSISFARYESTSTEVLQKVWHRKWRDSALPRLPSAAFPVNSFSSDPVIHGISNQAADGSSELQGDHGGLRIPFVDFDV